MIDEYVGDEAYVKASQLTKLGTDASGWDTYLRDERSGEYWLLYYPDSYQHGGGLRILSALRSLHFWLRRIESLSDRFGAAGMSTTSPLLVAECH
ncbi:Imm27 family immunity protein [Rhodoferax sp. GW822-FHT02A01]|uniref:Imm27 family immunity protein n=1 Tax=Rhodoferax sp. GW822-FHT02A01 TaxID=3141537 RepID=UPI00315D37A5